MTSAAPDGVARRRARLGLLFLSMSVLLLEVCLTRVFSIVSWYHFAYLIISLALLGFSAAGSYLTVRQQALDASSADAVGRHAWHYALAAMAAIVLLSSLRLNPEAVPFLGYRNLASLLLIELITAVPFFFAGLAIGRLVAWSGPQVSQFYFTDLVGAGLGALAALIALSTIGAVAGVFVAAALAALAAWCLGAGTRPWRWAYATTCAGAVALVALTTFTRALPLHSPPSKEMFSEEGAIEFTGWSVTGRIDVGPPGRDRQSFGGVLSQRYTKTPPPARLIYQDGGAPAGILGVTGRAEDEEILGEYLQGVAYVVRPVTDALVIGIGGGVDALIAMHHGAKRVVGVDINPVIVDAVSNRFRTESAALWRDPGRFQIEVSEGRHYLTRTGASFDVIQLSGVDSFTALAKGAYALNENFLYTEEAQAAYWSHLTSDGILSFSRWLFDPPRESLRLVNTQLSMLERAGVFAPSTHFVIVAGGGTDDVPAWAETLLKKTPFVEDEVDRVAAWAGPRGFRMIYDPFHAHDNAFNLFLSAATREREALIEQYPYAVSPTTDDRPFFFNFYRWDSLLQVGGGRIAGARGSGGYYPTTLPLGQIVLVASVVQTLVLGAVAIGWPLVSGRGQAARSKSGRGGVLIYFGALGLGFMFVEMALLQRFTVFVGGPGYSLAITLASLLMSSGVGASLARGFGGRSARPVGVVLAGIVAVVIGEAWFLNRAVPALLDLAIGARWLVTALACLPAGVLLGMPFPMGLRILEHHDPTARAWAWGVNGFASVLGSMLCVVLSMAMGFTFSLYAACAIYSIGGVGLWVATRRRGRSA